MQKEYIYLTVIIIYVFAVFFISWWRSRGVKSQEEFMVAGRSAPAWLLVGSLICTWIGAGSLLGGGGRVYREGLSQLWMSAGAWAGIIIIYFLAERVQRISQFTVQDILEKRYHPYARILGAIAVILGSTIIFAYQLKGVAFVIEEIFEVPQIYGIMLTGGLIVGFTVFAGLKSILAMDMLNGGLIILAIFIGLPLMLGIVGGQFDFDEEPAAGTVEAEANTPAEGVAEAAPEKDGSIGAGIEHVHTELPERHFQLFGSHDLIWALGVFFPTFFLLLGESSMYQKFYSARSGGAVRGAVIGFFIGVVLVETALAFFALTASSHPETDKWRDANQSIQAVIEDYNTFEKETAELPENERTSAGIQDRRDALYTAVKNQWPEFVADVSVKGKTKEWPEAPEDLESRAEQQRYVIGKVEDNSSSAYKNRTDSINLIAAFHLPIWAGALLLAGGIAIVFSTGNSFMMAASTSFTRDIYQRFLNKDASEKSIVITQRITMFVLAIFAVAILTVFTTVWEMALAAYTIIGCTLTPVILAAFLWKRVTPAAGVTSLAMGLIVWITFVTLKLTNVLPDFEYDYIIYPAGGASILSLIVVSFFTKPKPAEEVAEFIPEKKRG